MITLLIKSTNEGMIETLRKEFPVLSGWFHRTCLLNQSTFLQSCSVSPKSSLRRYNTVACSWYLWNKLFEAKFPFDVQSSCFHVSVIPKWYNSCTLIDDKPALIFKSEFNFNSRQRHDLDILYMYFSLIIFFSGDKRGCCMVTNRTLIHGLMKNRPKNNFLTFCQKLTLC